MTSKINIQTRPIDPDDSDFVEILEFIDELMRKRAYPAKLYKGSCSWLPAKEDPGSETIAKLCYLGPDDYCFGLREEECEKYGLMELRFPLAFGVRPKTEPTFYGFPVNNNQSSRQALEKFIGKIPEAPQDRQLGTETGADDFDVDDFLKQF